MVLKLASGQATINEVINPGTKNAKLVTKGIISFSDAVPMAIANVTKLLYAFPQIFNKVGIYVDKYSDNIDTAIEFIPKMSTAVKHIIKISKSVSEIPADSIDFTNVKKLLFEFPRVFATLGMYIDKYSDSIDTATEFMPKMSTISKQVVSVSKSYLEITNNINASTKNGKNIDRVLTGFASSLANMGTSFEKMDNNKVTLYKRFASITEGMTKITTPFEKFTKTFGQFTKDMGIFVNVWDGFGKDNASNLKIYADSLKTIASVDAGKLSAITKALKEQAQAQAALNNMQKNPASGAAAVADGKIAAGKTNESNKQTSTNAPMQQQSQQNQQVPASQGSLAGGVIARLEVTNLYINGKLQK
jgi:hypothetical protein